MTRCGLAGAPPGRLLVLTIRATRGTLPASLGCEVHACESASEAMAAIEPILSRDGYHQPGSAATAAGYRAGPGRAADGGAALRVR